MSHEAQVHSASSLAERLEGRLIGRGDVEVRGVNTLDDAGPDEVTFINDKANAQRWASSRATVAVVTAGVEPAGHDPDRRALIEVANAELAIAALLELFAPASSVPEIGVHPSAVIDPTVRLGRDTRVGPHASVDRGCTIGDEVVLHAGVRIYAGVSIGDRSVVHANTVVRERCRIGADVILHDGVSIGADGFGYRPAPDGSGLVKMPHLGDVVIGDRVEIGAGTCVDRAKFGSTVIGAGTKIDNLVQIGHNCRIGENCVIAGLAGLCGSVVMGNWVVVAGMVGIGDHLTVGDGATVAARTGVTRSVPAGETWLGYPAGPMQATLREWASLRRLPEFLRRSSRAAGRERRSRQRPPDTGLD